MNSDALSQLEDIYLPNSIDWWPIAPGWWITFFLVISIIVLCYLAVHRHRKKWHYRKVALQSLSEAIEQHLPENTVETCQHLITTLKRCAMTAYPAERVNGVHGEQWTTFLNQHTKEPYFNQKISTVLTQAQYQANANIDKALVDDLYEACQQWVKKHSVKNTGGRREHV